MDLETFKKNGIMELKIKKKMNEYESTSNMCDRLV